MLDLFLASFVLGLLALGLRRPFLWVLAYLYIDIVAPQKISYFLLASIPISLIVFVAAFGGWLASDDKRDSRFTLRQGLLVLLLCYCGLTTATADFPDEALAKWDWVWKALVFASFLPLTLRTRLRIEGTALVMVLAASSIIITGGIKTAVGGGYGGLKFFVNDNTGLYEGSIISCVAIAIIPVILWLMKHGTVFRPDWRVKLFGWALIFSCLLIPVGTEARTGLICIGLLGVLSLRTVKNRFLYVTMIGAAAMIAIPFLPATYTARMSTIENHKSDESASTRIAVWAGLSTMRATTRSAAVSKPIAPTSCISPSRMMAAAVCHRQERQRGPDGASHPERPRLSLQLLRDAGRAGLSRAGAVAMAAGARAVADGAHPPSLEKDVTPETAWRAPLANALQQAQVIYLAGSLFVGIAYQPFILMLIGLQCGLWSYLRRIDPKRAPVVRAVGANGRALNPAPPSTRHLDKLDACSGRTEFG